MAIAGRHRVEGPYFEDLETGRVFDDAPPVTLTPGHAAFYGAAFGDRMRLPLDVALSAAVTGRPRLLAHPLLVCNLAIGQTTGASQRVRGNLFYRGLVLQRPVFLGDTLRTRTEVVGRRQNRPQPGRPATGLVALRVRTENQEGEPVLDFWRCPMIPLRNPDLDTGCADAFDEIAEDLDETAIDAAVPASWRLEVFRDATRSIGPHFDAIEPGTVFEVEGRDCVTAAPELTRLTLNLAETHLDRRVSAYGRRLVYGGYTISVAGAQLSRALPGLVTVLAWRGCDHLAPVFEEDLLRSEITIVGKRDRGRGSGLLDLRIIVHAERAEPPGEEVPVLDWRLVALGA